MNCFWFRRHHQRAFIHELLRGYQRECIEKSLEAFRNGIRRQAVSLPVGSGKTVIFSNLIREIISKPTTDSPKSKKALVLAHREELLLQACRQIERWCPGAKIALDQGATHANPEEADVIVASVPSLGRINSEERRSKYDPSQFGCIIVDEAHHAAAPTYQRIFEHFQVQDRQDLLLWGCSATLSRNDELALSQVFDQVVFHIDLKRMMDEGWLSPAHVFQIETDVDLSGVRMSETRYDGKDFNFQELNLAVNTPERNRLVVDTWRKFALGEHQRRSTIVFGLGVSHVQSMQAEFARIGVQAEYITGTTPDAIRTTHLEDFARGRLPVLINCAVLTEGTDLPITDCILLTRPTCNANLYIQMVGRGLRRHPDKKYCLVLDVVDKYRKANRSLITFPTLEAAMEPTNKLNEPKEELEEHPVKKPPTELSEIERIRVNLRRMTEQSVVPDLQLHRLAWVRLDARHYLCSGREHEYLLEINDLQHPTLPSTITHPKDKTVVHSGPLHECLEAFARYLRERDILKEYLSNSYWRKRFPMTQAQHRILQSLAGQLGAFYEEFAQVRRWNVGQASNILTRYFGSRKHLGPDTIKTWNQLIQGVSFESFYHPIRSKKTTQQQPQ